MMGKSLFCGWAGILFYEAACMAASDFFFALYSFEQARW
jgi:hypothetical protein